jgi:hypothetical protein
MTEMLEHRAYLSSAAISFAASTDVSVGNAPVAITAADFNGDGHPDLAVADNVNQTVTILFGNGTGGFTAGPVLTLTARPTQIITGDFNGDGHPDIAVASSPGNSNAGTTVTVFINSGTGTFALGQATTIERGVGTTEPIAIAAGDFNADGHLDIVATEYSDGLVAILNGTGTGTFAAPITYNVGSDPTAIAVGDFNNDGALDIAVTTGGQLTSADELYILDGSGAGTFSAGSTASISSAGSSSIAVAYLSGDTHPDLVVGGSDGSVSFLTNSGGTFSVASTTAAAGGVAGIAVADFNLDGYADVATADGGTSFLPGADDVTVVTGASGGTAGNVLTEVVGSDPQAIAVADFNGDGKPDIAVANEGTGTVSILINNTAVVPITVTNMVTLSSDSTAAGSAVTIMATLAAAGVSRVTGEATPTGTMDFYDGTTLIGSGTIVAGTFSASFTTTSLTVGTHNLSATYQGDTAYASQHGAAVVETITPVAGDTPDLEASVVSDSFGTAVVPGATGTLRVRITNAGNATAEGTLGNDVYLSLDQTLDANDQSVAVKGTLGSAKINLKPKQSILLTGSFTVPLGETTATYYPLIAVDPTGSFSVGASNNVIFAPGTAVVPEFGTVGGHANIRYELTGLAGGATATFRLTGPGTGTVNVGDAGVDVVLAGTTARSSVVITTTGGTVVLDDITAGSAVGAISAGTVSISGTAALSGGVGSLLVQSLTGATVTIGAGAASALSLGTVSNSNVSSAGGVRSLTVSSFNAGTLSAGYLSRMTSKGDFTPTVVLTGGGAPRGVAAGSLNVRGSVGPSDWIIDGNATSLSIGTAPAGWDASITGAVRSLTIGGAFGGEIAAATAFSSVLIRGDLTGQILAGINFGPDGRPGGGDDSYAAGSIGSVRVTGSTTDAVIGAGVSPVAGGYTVLPSGSIRSLTINGTADADSRFLAAVLPAKVHVGGVVIVPTTDPRFGAVA